MAIELTFAENMKLRLAPRGTADLWRGSNNAIRREILDAVYLNRTLSEVSLFTEKRKPFDELAKRPYL